MVEIHSRGAVDKGKPITKQASVPIEISIEKEIDGIQIGCGESLIASGIIEIFDSYACICFCSKRNSIHREEPRRLGKSSSKIYCDVSTCALIDKRISEYHGICR